MTHLINSALESEIPEKKQLKLVDRLGSASQFVLCVQDTPQLYSNCNG